MVISEVKFASYGTASGDCHTFALGSCHEASSKEVVEDLCLGENECALSASSHVFGEPCGIVDKNLRVEVECAVGQSFYEDVYFNAWSNQNWPNAMAEIESRRDEWKEFLETLPEYPTGKFSGRGIIIVAGGQYLEPAVVTINMIRKMTSTLRIQVWHLGDEEMTDVHRKVLEPYNVETRDFKDYVGEEMLQPIQANVGMRLFQLKPLAMLHSDLEDILLLDSDNCPVRDPTFLFDSAEFKETGSLFWPDYWRTSLENPIWEIVGRSPVSEWEQESGQLVLNKESAWKAVNLAIHFNSEFYMKLLNGDKDTFRFSWVAADVPYTMVQTLPTPIGTLKELYSDDQGFCSHTMLQHDLSGKPLFVHHNQIKNTVLAAGENFKYQKLTGAAAIVRAVPVAALHVNSGSMISCIDLQCIGEDCAVTESGLDQFEADYFAAQASIPAGTFTKAKHATPSIVNAKGHKVSEKRREQIKLQQLAANRLRRDTNTTCTPTEFELVKPTVNNDRVCEIVTICSGAQSVAPTTTSDRVCTPSTPRATKAFAVSVGDKTASHPYFNFGSDMSIHIDSKEAPEIRLTRLESYDFVLDANKEHSFMLTLDAIGGTNANAYTEAVHGSAAEGDTVISFSPNPLTPSMLYYQSKSSTHMGWRVHVSDPTFTLAHSGAVGARTRFASAFSPIASLFQETGVAGTYDSVRQACEKRCAISAACRGVHIYRAVQTVTCTGLNDVGAEAQSTHLDSESILKVVF
jgi:hypothetical protein